MRGWLRAQSPEALYARFGVGYIERYYRALYASVFFFAAPATWAALVLTTEGSIWTYLGLFTAGTASSIGALWLCVRWSRRNLAPARTWHEGAGAADTLAAWRAVVRTVPDALLPCFTTCLLGSGLPWAILVAVTLELSAVETVLAVVCVVIFALYPVVLNSAAFEIYLAPLKRDIARHLPADYEIERPFPSMRQWLLASLPIVTLVNGLFVAFYASSVADLTLKVTGSVLVTLSWTFAPLLLIVHLLIRPVEELTEVTARIRAGDLTARAVPEREDELGILLLEFNRMSDDLVRAREHLVSAREEERRRLRRDLHDGLGAAIAAVSVQLQAAMHALDRDPLRVAPLLQTASDAVRDALDDVRELVYGLRPPALDAFGLLGAVRDHATSLGGPGAPQFEVRAGEELGELPAAVEVAALRIAQEAMTNVVRHAHARSCVVELSCNGTLTVSVRDDGVGFAGQASGVGMLSMRERASELGGTVSVSAVPGGGTEVVALLPAEAS
ncbi:MAG TPA: sensor histidine kinase [Solirubrobacteraceae bacterium]